MTIIPQERWSVIAPGEYLVTIESADVSEGRFGAQVEFLLSLEDGPMLKAWVSAKFSPRSKLYLWTRAAFGQDIPEDYDLDLDHLVGRQVLATIVTRLKDDNGEFSKVDSLRAYHPPRPAGASGRPGGGASGRPGAAANGRPGAMPGPGAAAGGPGVFPPAPPDPPEDDYPF